MLTPDTAEGTDLLAPIKPGTYPASITAATPKVSKKGSGMVEVKVTISVNGKEKKRTANVVVSGPGAAGFDQLLRATNFDKLADTYKDPTIQPKPDFDEQTLVGQSVNVVVDHQMYNNETRDQIKGWLKA
jgi:hypothetical protein